MTGSDGSDGERSESPSERSSRFSDIASEFTDEFGEGSADSPESHHESESLDAGDDTSGRGSDPNDRADSWEWIGDDKSGDTADRTPSDPDANEAPKRSDKSSRVWNDGPIDDDPRDDGLRDDDPTEDTPVDDAPIDDEPVDDIPLDVEATADFPIDDEPPDDKSIEDSPVGAGPADADQPRDGARRTGSHAAGAEPKSSVDNRADETGGRIWDAGSTAKSDTTSTESVRSPSDGTVSATASPTGTTEELDPSALFDERQLSPGTNVLIQSESRSEKTQASCHQSLFEDGSDLDPYVLLIRYQSIQGERLEEIASKGYRTHVISVGYAQSVPPVVDGLVEVTQINNPNDITRLGIIVSRVTQGWSTDNRQIRVCYDSLNVLLNYRDVKNTFRFLHVFLSTFTKADAVAHFHADPLEGDPQAINTLKPLFDEVISIDSTGTYVE